MKNLGAIAIAMLLLAASLAEHLLAWAWLRTEVCEGGGLAIGVPARASWQGWTCGAYADSTFVVPAVWALSTSTILAVAAAGWIWSRGGAWPWLSPIGLVGLPLLTTFVLTLPADSCTTDQRAEHGPVECETRPSSPAG